jgi:hypothetical protein
MYKKREKDIYINIFMKEKKKRLEYKKINEPGYMTTTTTAAAMILDANLTCRDGTNINLSFVSL